MSCTQCALSNHVNKHATCSLSMRYVIISCFTISCSTAAVKIDVRINCACMTSDGGTSKWMVVIATSNIITAYQMTKDWSAFDNPHISKLAVTVSDTEPKIYRRVYLCICSCGKSSEGLLCMLPAPVGVNT